MGNGIGGIPVQVGVPPSVDVSDFIFSQGLNLLFLCL